MKEGWKYSTLEECCNINYGTRVVRAKVSGDKYPVYGGGGETFRMDEYNREDCLVVSRFAMSKMCTRIVKGKFYLNDSGLTVYPKDPSKISPLLVERYLLACNDLIYSYGRGSAQRNLNMTEFRSMPFSYPLNFSEQQRIVEYLDSTFAEIDALKAKAAEEVANAKAMFDAALREEMTPKEGWEEMKFSELCHFVRGPFGGSLKKECFVSEGYAVYEQQNAIYNKFTFRYYVDKEKYESLHRFAVKPGNLIMSCSGTIGRVAIIPSNAPEGIINQALLMLSPKGNIDVNFLRYLMTSDIFNDIIASNSDGAAIKNIASVAILKTVNLSIPTLNIQQHIVSHLDNLSSLVTSLEQKYAKIVTECDALKQAILKQVFE